MDSIGLLIESNARVEKAIDDFNKSSSRTEKFMMAIAVIGLIVAVLQIVIVFIHKS